MSKLFWLTEEQLERIRPHFPKERGRPRVDDRRVLSGIIHVNRNRISWSEAPAEYGSPKSLYTRWKRWNEMGVIANILKALADENDPPDTLLIDATYLKVHCNVPGGPRHLRHDRQAEEHASCDDR